MIKCPYCGAEIELDYGSDIEATMWNFDGESADIEMYVYCEKCDNTCFVSQRYNMIPTNTPPKIYKR